MICFPSSGDRKTSNSVFNSNWRNKTNSDIALDTVRNIQYLDFLSGVTVTNTMKN